MKSQSTISNLTQSVLVLAVLLYVNFASAAQPLKNESEITFKAASGQTVAALQGWLEVPENRTKEDSRRIKLNYVRFPATNPDHKSAAPIVYLAGGPGGSGIATAKRQRFPLFMAMREFGDVIAFDQRGLDDNRLPCQSSTILPAGKVIDDERYNALHAQALQQCLTTWKEQGFDIYGYTTQESAADLNALRLHLGAEKISLWGISYGSHLALAALKEMDDKIDKVVLASVEGLDQTIKMPARTDRYFGRLQTLINQEPTLQAIYPDIESMIRKVHTGLDNKPLMLEVVKNNTSIPIAFQKRDMQSVASSMIADPGSAFMLLGIYAELLSGKTDTLVQLLTPYVEADQVITFSGMSTAMDLASGISKPRYIKVMQQVKTGMLADKLNFGLHHFNDIPNLDLGDAFRSGPVSKAATLVLSGTLDGRTYLESQAEAVAGLSEAKFITVQNAGHNLFMSSPKVTEVIQAFMRDQELTVDTIVAELPGL